MKNMRTGLTGISRLFFVTLSGRGSRASHARVVSMVMCLLMVSCSAAIQQNKQQAQVEKNQTGAAGVQQACRQSGMMACDELRMSFEQFATNQPGAARKHLRNVLLYNQGIELNSLTQTLDVAARIAGPQGATVQQFSAFLYSVVQGNAPMLSRNPGHGQNPGQKSASYRNGCTYDAQCKFDRVCIDGECISSRYMDEMEAKYMAASKGVVLSTNGGETADNTEKLELELLTARNAEEVAMCGPDQVARCMRKCERGDAEHCYAVGKLYEQFPANDQYTEYLLFAYQKACSSGLNDACIDLGNLYFHGRFGERNMSLAYQFNNNACIQGNGVGCVNIARMLKSGMGVAQNAKKADEYYLKACVLGQSAYCVGGIEDVATETPTATVSDRNNNAVTTSPAATKNDR